VTPQHRTGATSPLRRVALAVPLLLFCAAVTVRGAEDAHDHSGHVDPFGFVLLELASIVLMALMGRWAAVRLGQPTVLGELLIGVIVGNLHYWAGVPFFTLVMLGNLEPLFSAVWTTGLPIGETARQIFTETDLAPGGPAYELLRLLESPDGPRLVWMGIGLYLFSSLGVILLLLMVGLESSIEEMQQVGPRAAAVAVVGVVVPFVLGAAVGRWLLPEAGTPVHLFLAATLCATSVGITARVFKDLGRLQGPEARVILGAAVIDDVLGLVILAVVIGIVSSGSVDVGEVARISLSALAFLGLVIVFGDNAMRRVVPLLSRLDRRNARLLVPLALAFVLGWFANLIGLATIVGAFAAGLILSEAHFGEHFEKERFSMERLIGPLETVFAPIFFVVMGLQVNLRSFGAPGAVRLALAFTAAAVLGKIVAGAVAGRIDRLSVGLGMIPRGEVGLIFASIGKGLGIMSDAVFSAIVIMVIVTTLITPLALKWSLARSESA